MSETKKPVVVLLMHDGAVKEVVCDTHGAVTCVMVNIVSEWSPQEGTQKLNLTLPGGEKSEEFTADVRRLGVKYSRPGDTVIEQFVAAAPPDEYDIDHCELVQIDKRTKRVVRDDGKMSIQTSDIIGRFAETYKQ